MIKRRSVLRYDGDTVVPIALAHPSVFIMDREKALWLALGAGTAIGAGMLARQGASAAWRRARNENPPLTIEDDASWSNILAWAAISGFCVAFARVVGRGVAHKSWRQALGRNPPTR